jgi:serine protease AprX
VGRRDTAPLPPVYDPNCNVAGESAALLDIGAVSHRALAVTSPMPGTWTVGVYGRVNGPTNYTGVFQTHDKS